MKQQDKLFVTLGTVAVVGIASVTGYALFATKDTDTSKTRTSQSKSSDSESSPGQSSTSSDEQDSYKDGTYSATVDYRVPEGTSNTLQVKLTIAEGTVKSVEATTEYVDRESLEYIDPFEEEIEGTVLGKPLGDLSVSRVGGASLTSAAFNDVLDTIRDEAA